MSDTTIEPVAPAARPRLSLRFSARDLLNVAIFAVIYFVVVFAIAMLGIIGPLVMVVTLPLAAIAAGVPYMLFLTRVRHAGMVTLFGGVLAVLYLMTGQPWQSTLFTIALAVLADLVLWTGRYRSTWAAIWTYTVFSAWFFGPWIPFFLDPVAYFTSHGMADMGEEYVAAMVEVLSPAVVLAMSAAAVVCGFLGALLGTALLRKHFRRAGLA
ncbi:MAG TPA: MptD family putative ECF transporter S component [Arachnia sp.]|nr:MptD family putative ECF transporter S component [Arachnia sp.]HMT85632.1 MptD family putative ECF transporter S component [Arachnia sp.]